MGSAGSVRTQLDINSAPAEGAVLLAECLPQHANELMTDSQLVYMPVWQTLRYLSLNGL